MISTKKATSPSRSSSSRATAKRAKPVRRSVASRATAAPAVKSKRPQPVAAEASLTQRVVQKAKTKTGLAVIAGAVLAGVAGVVYKKRAAH